MSLRLHFASLSYGAAVDQQTGSLSVFDVIEEIRAPQLPVHLQSIVLSATVEKMIPQAFSGKVVIQVELPDGKQGNVGHGEIKIPAEQKRMKAIFRLGGFPLQQFGPHRFVLNWTSDDNQKIGETVLDFEVLQMSSTAKNPGPGGMGTPGAMTH